MVCLSFHSSIGRKSHPLESTALGYACPNSSEELLGEDANYYDCEGIDEWWKVLEDIRSVFCSIIFFSVHGFDGYQRMWKGDNVLRVDRIPCMVVMLRYAPSLVVGYSYRVC